MVAAEQADSMSMGPPRAVHFRTLKVHHDAAYGLADPDDVHGSPFPVVFTHGRRPPRALVPQRSGHERNGLRRPRATRRLKLGCPAAIRRGRARRRLQVQAMNP
jgi:hypothetical protein